MNYNIVIDKIRSEIKKYFLENNLKYAVFGKSEGLDSSVIAGLLSGIPEIKPIAAIIPIESNPITEEIAKIVLTHYQIPYVSIDLTEEYKIITEKYRSLNGQLKGIIKLDNGKIALGNIKARLRMITLYHIAKLSGGIVISSDNFSEYNMGFWTLNGDVGDLAPIQQIFKGKELSKIAECLGVPNESLNAIPTDGLNINGTDKDQLFLDYPELDENIISFIKTGVCDTRIANIIKKTEYKRHWPKIITREEIGLKSIYEL